MNQKTKTFPKFIGREVQLEELKDLLNSDKPEFIAVYGRRRVGKTFLIREAANDKFAFYFTAAYNVSKDEQLTNFSLALKSQFNIDSLPRFVSWFEAFSKLGECIDNLPKENKKIIFFDELPWADTSKSSFLPAFENFWNVRCAFRNDIKLIVCGSATSWIINKVLRNRGGLHNRVTHSFRIEPFTLRESALYFKAYGYSFSERQIAEIYMIMGGIPYYFSLLKKGESVSRNVDRLFFSEGAVLRSEFEILYSSLYRNPNIHEAVVLELAEKGIGLTRQELIKRLKITSNGSFSQVLRELEECGFIRSYQPFENAELTKRKRVKNNVLYQLIDLYSLFYLRFIRNNEYHNDDFFTSNYRDPIINIWRGLAFETLSLLHTPQIKQALGITGISTQVCSWFGKTDDGKAQIDLLINRKDNVINICEMKYSSGVFALTKKIAEQVEKKIELFLEVTKNKKTPVVTFITTEGIKLNQYSELVQKDVTLSQLFRY